MLMSKPATNLMLVVFSILTLQLTASAQNSLTAKANSIQPVNAAVESDRVRDGLAGHPSDMLGVQMGQVNGRAVRAVRVDFSVRPASRWETFLALSS